MRLKLTSYVDATLMKNKVSMYGTFKEIKAEFEDYTKGSSRFEKELASGKLRKGEKRQPGNNVTL